MKKSRVKQLSRNIYRVGAPTFYWGLYPTRFLVEGLEELQNSGLKIISVIRESGFSERWIVITEEVKSA